MNPAYDKSLTVGKTDTYTYTIDSLWLSSDTISTHDVIVNGAELTKNSSSVDGNVIGVSLTAITAGVHDITFEWSTSDGRSDCATVRLVCSDSC